MLKKLLLLAPVCLALSACVVYAPTYVSNSSKTVVHYEATSTSSQYSSNVKQKTKEVSERVVYKEKDAKQHTLAECDNFILPREVVPDYVTRNDLYSVTSTESLDLLLGNQVLQLQTYIDSMHSKIEQAHLEWLESCQKKLLD